MLIERKERTIFIDSNSHSRIAFYLVVFIYLSFVSYLFTHTRACQSSRL